MSGRHRIGTRFIVASMLVGLGLVAPTLARAAVTVNLDQWASTDQAWQNGNLNGNNSRYPEGGIVPFRLALEGLKAGSHSIHIDYDFTAGGHKAYDFLATWNVDERLRKGVRPERRRHLVDVPEPAAPRRAPRSRPTPSRRTVCRCRAPRSIRARRAA